MMRVLDNLYEEIKKKSVIKVNDNDGIKHLVHHNDILFLKAEGSYTAIIVIERKSMNLTRYIISKNIGEMEKSLFFSSFLRVHRSYIVNMIYIKTFDSFIELMNIK